MLFAPEIDDREESASVRFLYLFIHIRNYIAGPFLLRNYGLAVGQLSSVVGGQGSNPSTTRQTGNNVYKISYFQT